MVPRKFQVHCVAVYDTDADNRVVTRRVSDYYASKAAAEANAEFRNAAVYAKRQLEYDRKVEIHRQAVAEHEALVAAGLRDPDAPGPHRAVPTLNTSHVDTYTVESEDVY